jgi:hypothetical protein
MAYADRGDGIIRKCLCVHGLTHLGRDFDRLARMRDRYASCVLCRRVARATVEESAYYAIPQYVADWSR